MSPPCSDKRRQAPQELSERTGVRVDYQSNGPVSRNSSEEIGPAFVELKRLVRYKVADLETWEQTSAMREMEHPASTALR